MRRNPTRLEMAFEDWKGATDKPRTVEESRTDARWILASHFPEELTTQCRCPTCLVLRHFLVLTDPK